MSLAWTIIVGFLVGLVARLVFPDKQDMGIMMTTLLGVAGSLAATYGGQALGPLSAGEPARFIGAVIGTLIILSSGRDSPTDSGSSDPILAPA
jgi:uncharacterized membrane protein YeaQ/YmgE (transglycosylase-associated protein family)